MAKDFRLVRLVIDDLLTYQLAQTTLKEDYFSTASQDFERNSFLLILWSVEVSPSLQKQGLWTPKAEALSVMNSPDNLKFHFSIPIVAVEPHRELRLLHTLRLVKMPFQPSESRRGYRRDRGTNGSSLWIHCRRLRLWGG